MEQERQQEPVVPVVIARSIDNEQFRHVVQEEAMKLPDMNIVVSGISGRFPKSDNINEFEEHLYNGDDMVNDRDDSRFTCGLWGLPPRAGRLNDLSRFDCEFFGFTVEEANYIDYQLRLLYEVVYESIIDAGVNPATLRGTNTGVYFGLHCNEFENAMADEPGSKPVGYYSQFAVKVAQYFDFRGITITFDAACASGFVGLHNAVQALNEGLIDQAVVCSSNIPIHPTGSFIFLQMQMLSPTGYSRFLDSRADGYVKSEACVAFLVQRKHLALRNYASIMATMTSVDGFKPEGITFPSSKSQELLIRTTKELAQISTNHVEYLEAHGTGTPAGDPQEASAISSVYYPKQEIMSDNDYGTLFNREESSDGMREARRIGPLLVGSVKTNMGHSEAASGLCALAKVVLMLENEIIYRGLHYDQPNSNIPSLMDGRLKFVDERLNLNSKVIPLSCYGFGGSNVHAILRANHRPAIAASEYQANGSSATVSDSQKSLRLIVMFGRTEASLNCFYDQLFNKESRHTRNCLTDDFLTLIDSLNSGKIDRLMKYRGYSIVELCEGNRSAKELARNFKKCELTATMAEAEGARNNQQNKNWQQQLIQGDECCLGNKAHVQECMARKCNLVLPGLGCQWPGMARGLQKYTPFWSTIERLADSLKPFESEVNLIESLIDCAANSNPVSMTQVFVSIVAYQVALINMIRDQLKLVNISYIVGHSLGEISCAYAAGLFDERETIMVAYQIGKTLDNNKHLVEGKMFAIGLSEAEAVKRIETSGLKTIRVSCVNGPLSTTVSGSSNEVDQFCLEIQQKEPGILMKQVDSQIAMHNEHIMNSQIKQLLKAALLKVLFPLADYNRNEKTSWISSSPYADSSAAGQANAEYFAENMCKKVDFLSPILRFADDSVVLELGPDGIFESQLRQFSRQLPTNEQQPKFHYVKLMKHSTPSEEQQLVLVKALGELYQVGVGLNFLHFNFGKKLDLPVRRQTPSLSSIFKWDHSHELFVPRYPIQFSKSAAKCELPVDIVRDYDKYITGHCIEGRILFPATGYLFLIWRVFSFVKGKIYDACFQNCENVLVPIEFHNVRLLRAVILGNRVAQLYIHYEEGTGRFEVKEGGSVVVEGYARTPDESPNGLLYDNVRDRIRGENLELTMSADDVYKQFRVSGYDYGETFRNIEQSSGDGRYCRVKYNGHFVSLTDSILQSIFLAITQYAPSGGLFLPTKFDYVRFQPEIILKKLREVNIPFDLSDTALNTKEKREIMTKMMQRESGENGHGQPEEADNGSRDSSADETEKPKPECIFETFCDPITGIIITDGIEMRGIKASPAPRRSDNKEVLLESYQFVQDFEEPIEDENLTNFEQINKNYSRICDSISLNLLKKLCSAKQLQASKLNDTTGINMICDLRNDHVASEQEIEAYKKVNLNSISSSSCEKKSPKEDSNNGDESTNINEYDIKKNGNRTLLSVLDQLESKLTSNPKTVKELVQKNRYHLMSDLIQTSHSSERFIRPLIETIIENICFKKMKLKLMEINVDDGIMKESLECLIYSIEPTMSLDYSLAHPDLKRLSEQKILLPNSSSSSNNNNNNNNNQNHAPIKTYTLKDLQNFFNDQQQLKDFDLIVYKDISCYSLPKQVIEQNGLAPVLTSLNGAIRTGGFVVMVMREKLTLAERILLALSEPELVGLKKMDLEQVSAGALNKINHINEILASRCRLMISEAQRNKMLFLAKKSDENGCTILMFRKPSEESRNERDMASKTMEQCEPPSKEENRVKQIDRLVLRVNHEDAHISGWLEQLQRQFKRQKPAAANGDGDNEQKQAKANEEENTGWKQVSEGRDQQPEVDEIEAKHVWLCAVATKQNPISGLVGMMRALIKELGSTRLRCYFDLYTFKDCDEPISVSQIEICKRFQVALQRDLLWNCVDSRGNFGSFRHFTINDYMSYEDCQCSKQQLDLVQLRTGASTAKSVERAQQLPAITTTAAAKLVKGAYVNNATRGDLSSFTWFEAPFEFLSDTERQGLVRVAYSALNFRDIMLATGRLPLDAIPIRLAMSDSLLGLEFSGFDTKGKRVMGMVFGRGIATHVICPEKTSIKIEIPDWLDLKEAATIPVVYATAIMALLYRGRMKRGESVLIHAGSGGVGQAAIRLAAHFGLQIFTTVGSEEKRQFLLDEFGHCLKADHIFSSRDCNFETQILEATMGQGVDLILNSLADDKLQASVRCLADGGRFLEIGKYDMSTDSRFELLRLETNKSFHGILLDKLFDTDDISTAFVNQLKCVLNTLKDGLREGYVKPIKYTMFKRNQIEEAFRFMATGKHIGKILIEIEEEQEGEHRRVGGGVISPNPLKGPVYVRCIPRFQLNPQKSYIVTGGLGGFGLELTKWLVDKGARFILLTSRTGLKTGYQKSTLKRLESNYGVKFMIVDQNVADTTSELGAEKLCNLALEFSPARQLAGIFHLAMVLKDTLLENMSVQDFQLVCRPKLNTCLYLDMITRKQAMNLDYFVAFSSVTSGKGNAGQANYAYANSCLEQICARRRDLGLHGLAIQWGAIGDVGVAFENLGGNNVIIGGTIPQRMPSCLVTLSKLLCSPFSTCLSVLPVNKTKDGAGEKGDLVGTIFHVLGIKDPSKVNDQSTLGELGLDSLMAVEIRQFIEREYDMTLNIQEIRSLTISKIRDIGENGKLATKSIAESQRKTAQNGDDDDGPSPVANQLPVDKPIEVQSYGVNLTGKLPIGEHAQTIQSKAVQVILDKSRIASFKPKLELPKANFCRLNYEALAKNGQVASGRHQTVECRSSSTNGSASNGKSSGKVSADQNGKATNLDGKRLGACVGASRRPIFFIPPIHGEFNRLELVCAGIKRPCIGLNWTRKLGRARTVAEAVGVYLDLLKSADWNSEFCGNDIQEDEGHSSRVVDLVGYSFGATIAFELMVAIQKQYQLAQKKNKNKKTLDAGKNQLQPGKLILLDGSPKQIELGQEYLVELARGKKMKLSEQLDELLMVYVCSHTKEIDIFEFQKSLANCELAQKVQLASKRLVKILRLNEKRANEINNYDYEVDDEPTVETRVAHAMEAFCRSWELIDNYRATASLPGDCTLIRAKEIYLSSSKSGGNYNEDYELSTVVKGKVSLFVMDGNHESFLDGNSQKIGEIIENQCTTNSTSSPCNSPATGISNGRQTNNENGDSNSTHHVSSVV